MSLLKRILWPVGTGLLGALFLTTLYFGLVSWAETPQHALSLFWQERWLVIPLILGFGVQVALFTIMKKRLFLSATVAGHSASLTGAGGATSTLAMVACCAHHVTDVLPILGLTFAAAFLAKYQTTFMLVALFITLAGIIVMLSTIFKERKRAIHQTTLGQQTS